MPNLMLLFVEFSLPEKVVDGLVVLGTNEITVVASPISSILRFLGIGPPVYTPSLCSSAGP